MLLSFYIILLVCFLLFLLFDNVFLICWVFFHSYNEVSASKRLLEKVDIKGYQVCSDSSFLDLLLSDNIPTSTS